jgi:hypothetical protein
MRRKVLPTVLGVLAVGVGVALAAEATDTKADFSPFERFTPLAASATCTTAGDDPFVLPAGYTQTVIAREGQGGTIDLWDMNTQNEIGTDAGRYVYRTHETGTGGQVSVVDLRTGAVSILAQRADWERLDGIDWTPWGSILIAEETNTATSLDPDAPGAVAGLVYELFVDPDDPTQLDTTDPRDDVPPLDGIAVRPALGSKSHEGMRFDWKGSVYGIAETSPGGIFRFVPDVKGDLSEGELSVYKSPNGRDGAGEWVPIPDAQARTNAQAGATAVGGNGYNRPEDVETGESTGKDEKDGGKTLYVAITGTDEVLAIELAGPDVPFAYQYVFNTAVGSTTTAPNATAAFDSPDNLALDSRGNLAITEDPSSNPVGADIWIAAPPKGEGRQPASTVQRFASLKDCSAEPTGIYFTAQGTEKEARGGPFATVVDDETLLVHRQHAGMGTSLDQLVAIRKG